jgi:hypothetical protein
MIIMSFSLLMFLWHPVSAEAVGDWPIFNAGFERGTAGWTLAGGWAGGPSGFINVTNVNVHSGNYSMEISSTIKQQAYFYQYIDFPNTSFVFSFWLFRASPTSTTACYLARDWDLNTARIVSSLAIQGNMIELNAWDAPYALGRQLFSYDVAVGSWHNITFVANGLLKTQDFYIDGNLITKLNSSSGGVFNPDILIFGDVTNEGCNGLFYFDDFELKPLENDASSPSPTPSAEPTPTPAPTQALHRPTLGISCRSSTSYSGFDVQLIGSLTFNESGIAGAPILLSYSVTGGKSWIDLTLVYTGSDGSYLAVWMPSATGNYLLKATFEGNNDYSNTTITVNFAVTPFAEQSVFSVISNSTITEFSFNSTSTELNFGVFGETGTTGYVNIYIPKSLLNDTSSLEVYLDGEQADYTVASLTDGWLLYFTYQHSTHMVTINLGSSAQTNENPLANWMFYGISLAIVIIVIGAVLALKRRKTTNRMPLSLLT